MRAEGYCTSLMCFSVFFAVEILIAFKSFLDISDLKLMNDIKFKLKKNIIKNYDLNNKGKNIWQECINVISVGDIRGPLIIFLCVLLLRYTSHSICSFFCASKICLLMYHNAELLIMLDGTKPLPELMLTSHQWGSVWLNDVIWMA